MSAVKRNRRQRSLAVAAESVQTNGKSLPVWLILVYLALGAWAIWGLAKLLSLV